MPLIRQRKIWWPTWSGWILLLALFLAGPVWWSFQGEAFLATTERVEANVLAVEGWIDTQAIRAATREFHDGGYQYVVATGGLTEHAWSEQRWSYAEIAAEELERGGIAPERILRAQARESDVDRTLETALAVRRVLEERDLQPMGVNMFTDSVHARRSRIVFGKVFGTSSAVGAIGWLPPGFDDGDWRQTSDRAKEFVMEWLAYAYERLWNSGRAAILVAHQELHPDILETRLEERAVTSRQPRQRREVLEVLTHRHQLIERCRPRQLVPP